MATITQTGQRRTTGKGFSQTPEEATDLDGYKELVIEARADNYATGGSTLVVELFYRTGQCDSDYKALVKFEFTASGSSRATVTEYGRYLRTKGYYANANSTSDAYAEVLVVPKS